MAGLYSGDPAMSLSFSVTSLFSALATPSGEPALAATQFMLA